MKIVRNILGTDIEIELTSDEVYHAYLKYEEVCDVQDVQTYIDNCDIDEFFEKHKVTADRVNNDADLIYSIAVAKRLNIDKHNMDWETALDEAFKDCLIGLDV